MKSLLDTCHWGKIWRKGGWILNVIKDFMGVAFGEVSNGGLEEVFELFQVCTRWWLKGVFWHDEWCGDIVHKDFFLSNGVLSMTWSVVVLTGSLKKEKIKKKEALFMKNYFVINLRALPTKMLEHILCTKMVWRWIFESYI